MNLRRSLPLLFTASLLVAACGDDAGSSPATTTPGTLPTTVAATTAAPATTTPKEPVTITLLAYDAFAAPDVLADFTARTGITVEVARGGDAGTLVNKAILTKGNPEGDVLWGLDNTLLSRATEEAGLFAPYEAKDLAALDPQTTALVPGHQVTPVDTGDVCLNYDTAWFTDKGIAPPTSFDDLIKPEYQGLLVVENPATSSPGLAFMLATVARFGPQKYLTFWKELRNLGVRVVDDWDTAYYNEFTAGGGGGTRPIVVSYASSPPATIIFAEDPKPTRPTTGNVEGTCFRQVEFAGILAGTKHPEAAQQLIDFLVSAEFQAELPMSNFVYPVRTGVALPDVFAQFGRPAELPLTVAPAAIAANRDGWIDAWTTAVLG